MFAGGECFGGKCFCVGRGAHIGVLLFDLLIDPVGGREAVAGPGQDCLRAVFGKLRGHIGRGGLPVQGDGHGGSV